MHYVESEFVIVLVTVSDERAGAYSLTATKVAASAMKPSLT